MTTIVATSRSAAGGVGAAVQPAHRPPSLLARLFTPHGKLTGALVAGASLLIGFVLSRLAPADTARSAQALIWASLAIGMVFGVRTAWVAIRKLKVNIDVLMVVGATLAAALGAPAEGSLLLFLFTLSGALEDLAMARTTRAVEALHKLLPTTALRQDSSGQWCQVEPESLHPGDRIRILPGELVPSDATLVQGDTSMNQASITGESMPRDVRPGDDLFAGTLNVGNPIEATVTRPAAQSSLQRILDLVTQAQQQRQPIQRLIDRLSQPYALAVFAASLGVMLIWRYVLGVPWFEEHAAGKGGAIYTAITLLIVASPCALIISTPTATLAAISRAARGGVLFKGGHAIERLARLRAVAFDKTGTLTIGRPRVMKFEAVASADPARLLSVAAALEEHSSHPIAAAIVELAKARAITPAHASDVKYTAGRGVSGTVDGKPARMGSLKHVEDLLPPAVHDRVRHVVESVQHRGHIAVVCAHGEGGDEAAVFILSDAARPGAECLVQRLHEMGVRPVVMLTGDNAATAARVAEALGIDECHAQLLPEEKVQHVQALKAKVGTGIGVIGDGVNDAPALAAADVSIAIGSIGSDAALESADIVLLSDDLSAVPWAVALARRARRTILINLALSISAIIIMAIGVLLGHWFDYQLPLWLGVLGHEGGTLLVVAHSLLLLALPGVPLCAIDRAAHLRAPLHTPLTLSAAHPVGGAAA